jgi:hypothetical protein
LQTTNAKAVDWFAGRQKYSRKWGYFVPWPIDKGE